MPSTTSLIPPVRSSKRSPRPPRVTGAWLPREDAALSGVVACHGAQHWSQIASHVTGRTAKQCRERWVNHLAPGINKEPFSAAEDQLLWEAVSEHGTKWTDIARTVLVGRTEHQLKMRWVHVQRRHTLESTSPPPLGKRKLPLEPMDAVLNRMQPRELCDLFEEQDRKEPERVPAGLDDLLPGCISPAHAHKDHNLLPSPARTSNSWFAVLRGTGTGCAMPLTPGASPFDKINRALRAHTDARKDAWDGLPIRFVPL